MFRPKIVDIPLYQDDRGSVYCAFDHLHEYGIKRTYVVENHAKGMVRAWHGHRKADTYMHVIEGAVKLAAMDMDNHESIFSVTLTDRKPELFYVPAGYYNGSVSLTDNTKILVYSTLTFDEVKSDNERADWNINSQLWGVKNR